MRGVSPEKKASVMKRVEKALELVEQGKSVREACSEAEIGRLVFMKNITDNQYARARSVCADVQFEEMEELEQRVLKGKLDPQAFRVAMDSRKWRLARMKPQAYSEKIQIAGHDGGKLGVEVDGKLPQEALDAIGSLTAAIAAGSVKPE